MNTLSWLLYLADSGDSLRSHLALAGGIGLFGYGMWSIFPFRHMMADLEDKAVEPLAKWPFVALFGLLLLSALIPRKETVYLIAASEMGAKAIETEMARDVYDIVKREIKKMKEAGK